jgi:hypothetical protein
MFTKRSGSVSLVKHNATKTCWGSEDINLPFLTSALDGGEWSASRHGRYNPRERASRYLLYRRLAGPQSRSGRYGEEKNLVPAGIETPAVKSVAQLSCPNS